MVNLLSGHAIFFPGQVSKGEGWIKGVEPADWLQFGSSADPTLINLPFLAWMARWC